MKPDGHMKSEQFQPGAESKPQHEVSDGKRPHVLLIEDDEVMREMLAEALRRDGCRVTECRDTFLWLQRCVHESTSPSAESEDGYDVIVSDIRMPKLSALDVLRILRDIRCAGYCPPTILITAFGDEATHQKARELGAATVLDKPFPIHELIQQVRSLEKWRAPES